MSQDLEMTQLQGTGSESLISLCLECDWGWSHLKPSYLTCLESVLEILAAGN